MFLELLPESQVRRLMPLLSVEYGRLKSGIRRRLAELSIKAGCRRKQQTWLFSK